MLASIRPAPTIAANTHFGNCIVDHWSKFTAPVVTNNGGRPPSLAGDVRFDSPASRFASVTVWEAGVVAKVTTSSPPALRQ